MYKVQLKNGDIKQINSLSKENSRALYTFFESLKKHGLNYKTVKVNIESYTYRNGLIISSGVLHKNFYKRYYIINDFIKIFHTEYENKDNEIIIYTDLRYFFDRRANCEIQIPLPKTDSDFKNYMELLDELLNPNGTYNASGHKCSKLFSIQPAFNCILANMTLEQLNELRTKLNFNMI